MGGPWEKYAKPASGPWDKYKASSPVVPQESGIMERAREGAIAGMVPGYSTYQAVKSGADGSNIAGAVGGDVANLAMLGLAGPTKLLQQTALGGALGAAGGALQPVTELMGRGGRAIGEGIFGTAQNSPSVAMNMLRNAPGAIGETVGELLPQAGMMFLTGKLANKMAKGPAPIPEAAQILAREGGQPTAAMQATGPISKGVLSSAELSARTNPLLEGKYRSIDEANAHAARQLAEKSFGSDVGTPGSNVAAGNELHTTLENLADSRGEAYKKSLGDMGAKLESIKDIKSAKGKAMNLGPSMAKAMDAASKDVSPMVGKMFEPLKAKLASGELTPRQVELELQDLRTTFDAQYSGLKQNAAGSYGALDRSFGIINRAMKDAYYDGLNKVAPDMGNILREAKGDYARASEGMKPLTRALTAKEGNAPETAVRRLMQSGTESLQALKENMTPEDWSNTRQQIAKTILDQAMGKDGISGAKLETLLNANKNIRDIIPVVFGEGQELGNIKQLIDVMKTAKQAELGVVNPSGSATTAARLGHAGALLSPATWLPLAAKTGIDVGYTYGAVPAQNALRLAQNRLAPIAGRISNLPRNQVIAQSVLGANRAEQNKSRTLREAMKRGN